MQAKLIAGGIIAVILISVITGCVWYFKWSQEEMRILNKNNASLVLKVKHSESAVASLKADASKTEAEHTAINKKYQEYRAENNKLRSTLARHNVGYLAAKKPGPVAKIINKGTADADRCFEILSGNPLTEKEIAATLKSDANRVCPAIANPNYTVKP